MIGGLLVVVVVGLVLVVGLEVVEVVVLCVILGVVVLCVVVAAVVGLVVVVLCVDLAVFAFVVLCTVGLTMEVGVGVKSDASNSGHVFDSNAVRLSNVGIFGNGM